MRRTLPLLVLAAALVAVALLVWWRRSQSSTAPAAPVAAASSNRSSTTSTPPPTSKRVTRLTPEKRAEVASQIQAARSARARPSLPPSSTPPAPSTAAAAGSDDMSTPQHVLDEFLKLADEIKGYVKDCATYAPDVHAASTSIMLVGDPDIGTLIDAPDPVPNVPAAFDECIRSSLQTLELPPMPTGDKFKVSFELAF